MPDETNPTRRRFGAVPVLALGLALSLGLSLGLSLALGFAVGWAADEPEVAPLAGLNDRFHANYRRARADLLAGAGPVVVLGFDRLALHRSGTRSEAPFPPPLYTKLKEVAHVPLMVYATLATAPPGPLGPDRRAEVARQRVGLAAGLAALDRSGVPARLLDRQRAILRSALDHESRVLADDAAPPEGLLAFARSVGPLVLANADDAARAFLARLDEQVQAWRAAMPAEEWRTVRAVVLSSHMARDREIGMQYFARLFGDPAEGRRVIFAEGITDEAKALDLVGTHLLDEAAASALFGDPARLHRDILADGATKALDSMTIRP